MAESSKGGGAFAKVVQRTLSRTKTKVLQRVGKADKTTDDQFNNYVHNFQKQQATALRLQKEMKHYLACVKAMTAAAQSLYSVINETYEEEWLHPDSVETALKALDMLQVNYEAELSERVYADIADYVNQFPNYKEKINKRRRKLLDFDNAKHEFESLKNAKKPDLMKVNKSQQTLQEAQNMFNEINSELHRELPTFHDYRIEFLSSNLGKLLNAESTFHIESGKVDEQLTDIMNTLERTHQEEVTRLRERAAHFPAEDSAGDPDALDLSSLSATDIIRSPIRTNGRTNGIPDPQESASRNTPAHKPSDETLVKSPPPRPSAMPSSPLAEKNPFVESSNTTPTADATPDPIPSDPASTDPAPAEPAPTPADPTPAPVEPGNPFERDDDDDTTEVVGIKTPPLAEPSTSHEESTTTNDSVVLYQVMATHPYVAEDDDELNFEAGEILNVIEFDDPEEQDEGWLLGISTSTNNRGVFPANFTQRISRKT